MTDLVFLLQEESHQPPTPVCVTSHAHQHEMGRGDASDTIYVGSLKFSTDSNGLTDYFSSYGRVISSKVRCTTPRTRMPCPPAEKRCFNAGVLREIYGRHDGFEKPTRRAPDLALSLASSSRLGRVPRVVSRSRGGRSLNAALLGSRKKKQEKKHILSRGGLGCNAKGGKSNNPNSVRTPTRSFAQPPFRPING